jgi:hypothetical protein
MPAQIVKLEIATRDRYDVIADQRTALNKLRCKAGLRSEWLNGAWFKLAMRYPRSLNES